MRMSDYRLGPRAAKQLKKIKKTDASLYKKISDVISMIQEDPYIGEEKKGDLKGYYCLDVSHLKTNYELCYAIEEDEEGNLIVVVFMGPRENFYPQLKRYLG
jgi:mRNA interferase RelE/StbE